MASVAHQTGLATWIDQSLDYLTDEWAAIPKLAAEWQQWDEADRLDFVLEWPLREDRLSQLQGWNVDGLLTSSQRQRYVELQQLILRHRSTLEPLLAD